MAIINLSTWSLTLCYLLLLLPLLISLGFGLKLSKSIIWAVVRMSMQLLLLGVFLRYLFEWNNSLLNVLWLMVMISVAVFSAVRESGLSIRKIMMPTFFAFTSATLLMVLYINFFVIQLDRVFDARYLIVLGGMLLGNALRGNVIGIGSFYKTIKKDMKHYHVHLACGASHYEALLPYIQESIQLALKPTLAAMATMGIVALPGMMTGAILAGADPTTAIKYQLMIMIAILVSTTLSVLLTILFTYRVAFDNYGIMQSDVLK